MNYIKPKTTVIKVETQTLLVGSLREGSEWTCNNVCPKKDNLRDKLFPITRITIRYGTWFYATLYSI